MNSKEILENIKEANRRTSEQNKEVLREAVITGLRTYLKESCDEDMDTDDIKESDDDVVDTVNNDLGIDTQTTEPVSTEITTDDDTDNNTDVITTMADLLKCIEDLDPDTEIEFSIVSPDVSVSIETNPAGGETTPATADDTADITPNVDSTDLLVGEDDVVIVDNNEDLIDESEKMQFETVVFEDETLDKELFEIVIEQELTEQKTVIDRLTKIIALSEAKIKELNTKNDKLVTENTELTKKVNDQNSVLVEANKCINKLVVDNQNIANVSRLFNIVQGDAARESVLEQFGKVKTLAESNTLYENLLAENTKVKSNGNDDLIKELKEDISITNVQKVEPVDSDVQTILKHLNYKI